MGHYVLQYRVCSMELNNTNASRSNHAHGGYPDKHSKDIEISSFFSLIAPFLILTPYK